MRADPETYPPTDPRKGMATRIGAEEKYSKLRNQWTQEAIDFIEEATSSGKYKTVEEVDKALMKKFSDPKYSYEGLPKSVRKNMAFVRPDVYPGQLLFEPTYVFPKDSGLDGVKMGSRYIDSKQVQTDLILKGFLNNSTDTINPKFKNLSNSLFTYFMDPPKGESKPILSTKNERELRRFSKKYMAGQGDTLLKIYLRNRGLDFKKYRLNNERAFGRKTVTELKTELNRPDITPTRKAQLEDTIKALQRFQQSVKDKLYKKYPSLFRGRTGGGALVFEHLVARSLADSGEVFQSFDRLPFDYKMRGRFVPAFFNKEKLKVFDKPLIDLIDQYESAADDATRKSVEEDIKKLRKNFNDSTKVNGKGYADNLKISFEKNRVILKDTTPVFTTKISTADSIQDILKNIEHSNKFFTTLGKQQYVYKGKKFEDFKKGIKNIKKFGEPRGFQLNSFAGILNLSDANIEIPESVKNSFKKVLPFIKGAGYATGPLATIPFVQQAERGLPLGAVIETGLARTAEDIVNLPALLYGGGKFLKEKLSGKEAEFELPYEATFGRKYSDFIEKNIPLKERQDRIKDFEIPRGVVDDMELLSDQEFDKMSEVYPEKFKDLMKASEKPQIEPENLDLTEQDNQVLDSLSQDGRFNFQEGSPPEIPGDDPDYSELQVMLDNPDKYNTFPKGTFAEEMDKAVYGTNEERNLLQKFNSMFLDPRVYPYYAQKLTSGAANIPELAFRFPAALAYLYGQGNLALASGDLDRIKGKTLVEALEILDPKYTREIKNTKFGDVVGISDKSMNEQDKTEGQKFVGGTFELGSEAIGPATPLFLFKMFPKLSKQIKDLVGTASAADKVNKEIEKNMAVNQTRRDLILTIGAGGAAAALKFLGLDKLIKAPKATKAVTSTAKAGGTPQYFFDFVDLIKRKGKDVSDRQAVVERQKVIEYKDYTLTETDGYITIRKTDEDMGRDEMMEYKPAEGIVDEVKGTAKEIPPQYDEATAKPDANDPGNFDSEAGFESIDDVLEELAKDGKKYSKEELEEMGIILGGAVKTEMAEGGIIAGVKSGPAPKSGPTPHGLPYVAKNVRPIKERK